MAILKTANGELINNNVPATEALADVEITNRFVKLAETIRKIAPRSDDFLYFNAIFMHASESSLIDHKTGEPKKDKNGKVITGGFDENWKWQCSDPSILPLMNQNKDTFPESELKKAYKMWVGRPLCVDHRSDQVEGVRGIILDTHYDEKYKRVVGLCALDRITYPDLAHKIKSGVANSVSMGCAVSTAICFVCGNKAITEKDYCNCMRSKRGEINVGLNPIELSVVVTPADPEAKVLKIIASMNNYVDQRNSMLEERKDVELTKLSALDDSIKTIESQLNRLFTECSDNSCQFVRDKDGHINLVKSAQAQQLQVKSKTWSDFFDKAKQVDSANDYEKKNLFDELNVLRADLSPQTLVDDSSALMSLADAMSSKNKYLRENYLEPLLEDLKTIQMGQPGPQQDHQFTTPDGPDKDLGLDAGAEVRMPANEQLTGERVSKVVNPSEVEVKPNKGGDLGPELGSASDRFQFGNYASNDMLMMKGGKKTADVDKNLDLLLKQTQEIETEMNKMKDMLNTNNTTGIKSVLEESKMNEARLKLRAEQRKALLEKKSDAVDGTMKIANLTCLKCGKVVKDEAEAKLHAEKEHKGEEGVIQYKRSYWLGTEEPTPGKPQYKPDNGGEPKNRMNDKQMKQDKSMGGNEGEFPGDEAEKKKWLRADLDERAMKRRAYWLGTEEPTPGKPQYKKDPMNEKLRMSGDKQMLQTKSMGGDEKSFPGDEAEKKKWLRAELVPGSLRTKFTKVRNDDGSINKKASYFEIFAGPNKLLKATADEIYGEELEKEADDKGHTYWDVLAEPELNNVYSKQVMAMVRTDGLDKVAELLKGAQAMPGMDAAVGVGPAPAEAPTGDVKLEPLAQPEEPKTDEKKVEVNANELMSLVSTMEDTLGRIRTEVTGEDKDEVKDTSVEMGDEDKAVEGVGAELQASLQPIAKEIYAELDQSADELALLVDYFGKSASLNDAQKDELHKIAVDAVNDGKGLLEEAETILAVAGKIPPGLKAFQDKQKGKKKGDEKDDKKSKDKDDMKDKGKDKKDEKKGKEDKKDKDKGKKKKTKKAELAEALMKIADELGKDDEHEEKEVELLEELVKLEKEENETDDMDKEMKELGLMPENMVEDKPMENCGMCGMAMDATHYCSASAKDDLVKEALAARRAKREAILKAAGEQYDVCPDTHGMEGEAHSGGGTTTKLDVKPAGDGGKVETIDEVHTKMMDAAESVPTGKVGEVEEVNVKEAELKAKEEAIKAELDAGMKTKKAEEDKSKYRVKLRRAYDLGLMMQEKGMIPRIKEALDKQVDEIMGFDDAAFESYKRAVANTQVKTASVKMPQVGVREDNSQASENVSASLEDQLKNMW